MNQDKSSSQRTWSPASTSEHDDFGSLSEEDMFRRVIGEVLDGSAVLDDHLEKTQHMIAHNLACLKSANDTRLHRNFEPAQSLGQEQVCIQASNTMLTGLTTIARTARMELDMRCELLMKIMRTVHAKGEQASKYEKSLGRVVDEHKQLRKEFERKSEAHKDLITSYSMMENKCKTLESDLSKTKEILSDCMKKSEKLSVEKKEYKEKHQSQLSKEQEKLKAEQKKQESTILELRTINNDLCNKIHDMKIKEKQMIEELERNKSRAETAVVAKGTQEKQIFDLKGNISAITAACKTKDLEIEEIRKDFDREQELNLKKIKKMEDDKEIMLAKRSESENLCKSLVFAFKAIKKIVPPESSSLVMEAIINMKPDSAVSYELDRIFVAISGSPVVNSNKIMERVIELAANKRDISDRGSTEFEACDKICRYFRIIKDQNSHYVHEVSSASRWSPSMDKNFLMAMSHESAGMEFKVERNRTESSKSTFSEDMPMERMSKEQLKELLRRKYKN